MKEYIKQYRKSINPPYSRSDIPIVGTTFLVLLVAVALVLNLPNRYKTQQDKQSQAQSKEAAKEASGKHLKKATEERINSYTLTKQAEALLGNIKFRKSDKEKSSKALGSLLEERKKRLVDLMKDDPASAGESLFSDEERKEAEQISPENTEKKVTLSGVYTIIHVHGDDFNNPEETENFNILNVGENQYYLYGDSFISKVKPTSTIIVSGYQFDNNILLTSIDSEKPSLVKGASTTSTLNIAVIGTRFTDTPTDASRTYTLDDLRKIFSGDPANDIIDYFKEASYGSLTINPSFYGIYTLPYTRNVGCSDSQLAKKIVDAADPDINYSQFNRIIFVQDCNGYYAGTFSSLTTADGTFPNFYYIGANSAGIKGNNMPQTIGHEIAHTLGSVFGELLFHANYYSCQPDIFAGPTHFGLNFGTGCKSIQYGDLFEILGQGFGHLNAYHKYKAGFFAPSNYSTVTTSGTYTLSPLEQSTTSPQGIFIPRGTTGDGFTVEYRQPIGYDSKFTDSALCPGCTVTQGPSVEFIHMEGSGETQGIDTTPFSTRTTYITDDYKNGAALTPGNTFTDPDYGISINTMSADANSTTVNVTVPTQTCTHNKPTVSISPASQTGSFAQTVNYTVTVTNNDTAGCQPVLFGASLPYVYDNMALALSPSYITLAPGTSGTMVLSVTPKGAISAGNQSVYFYIVSNPSEIANIFEYVDYTLTADPDTVAPSAPASLTAVALGSQQTKLAWIAATDDKGVVGYNIFRDGNKLATVTSISFIDQYLYQGTTYSYYVQAFDRKGNTANSNTITVTNPSRTDYVLPTCVTDFKETAIPSPTSVSMSWGLATDNVSVSLYKIVRNGQIITTLPNTATSYTDTDLPLYNMRYSYTVYVYDGDGNSETTCDPLIFYTASPGVTPPKQTTGLQGTATDANTVHLTWNANTDPGIAGYYVYASGVRLACAANNYFDDHGLSGNQYYRYNVQAYTTAGDRSALTPEIWVLTPGGNPPAQTPPPGGCPSFPSPTQAPNITPTLTPTPTPTSVIPTASPTPTPLPTSTPTPTPVPTSLPTPTPLPSPTPASDTPPVVVITQPTSGATIPAGKTITIISSATDNVAVTKVETYINGVRKCSDTTSVYTCSFGASATFGVNYVIKAIAYDSSGSTSSSTISVVSGIDSLPPTTVITSPSDGSSVPVNTNLTISAYASDTAGVAKVEFYINGSRKCSDNTPPYTCAFKTSRTAGTLYTILDRTYDYQGNMAQASSVNTTTATTTAGVIQTVANSVVNFFSNIFK